MKWFINLSTRTKLFVGFGMMILLLAVIAATARLGILEIVASQKRLQEEGFEIVMNLRDIRAHQNGIRADMLTIMLASDRSVMEQMLQEVKGRVKIIEEHMLVIHDKLQRYPQLLAIFEEFDAVRRSFEETREKEIIPLLLAGKNEAAKKIALGIQAQRSQQMRGLVDKLIAAAVETAAAQVHLSEARAADLVRLFLAVGGVAIFIGLVMTLTLNRALARPLTRITSLAEQVAAGDLTVNLPRGVRKDEVGILTQAFRSMLESVGGIIREMKEGVNVLASSATEILASTNQVTAGAAETASAVTETTTTVEEVKQTALVASERAKSVAAAAQQAIQVAQTGRRSVEESVAGMERIHGQVEAIAESIVRLADQGQAIGEIITTVNDLAEQSNLLAVNAAIEAAKAGEQGKGFGVVAQEVKTLAEQSKEATAQVRAILSDIQKATNAAVLATEQGTKAVAEGVRQSREAGEAIRQMGESIDESAQAAIQIAASSQQQLTGMDQMALAMENIRQASEQNVAGMRQVELTVQELHGLGQKLKDLVIRYNG